MEKTQYAEIIVKLGKAIEDLQNEYELKLYIKDREIEDLKKSIEDAEKSKTEG